MDEPCHGPALNGTWNLISTDMLEAATPVGCMLENRVNGRF